MEQRAREAANDRFMHRLREAFHAYGYEQINMVGLAKACSLSRRALYYHFSNKDEAFRGMLLWGQEKSAEAGLAAGRRVLAEGGSGLEIVVAVMDACYADSRRMLSRSAHAAELNYVVFRRFPDVATYVAGMFQDRLAELLGEMAEQGKLRLRSGVLPAALAQFLCEGVRGANQHLADHRADGLAERCRAMCEAILFGCCER